MSDMYIVLRSRLGGLREWVYIETDILRAAREAQGLSYETMSRTLPVSSKTWERYEKAGRIPRPMLEKVAAVLGLEIEQPLREKVPAFVDVKRPDGSVDPARLEEALERVEALHEKVDQLTALVRERIPSPARARRASSKGR